MSLEKNAVILWRLERLFERKGCQFLSAKMNGEQNLRQEILNKKDSIKKCPTGGWMFDKHDQMIKGVQELDVAELCVAIQYTELKTKLDSAVKQSFQVVRGVRNFLAHKGQIFGVEDSNYNRNLLLLEQCLKDVSVNDSEISDEKERSMTDDEKQEMKDVQIKSKLQ